MDSLATAYSLPVEFVVETKELAQEAYRIAHVANITYYDASFLALAKQEKAALVTDNPKHQKKIKEVKVIPLAEY